MAKKALIVFLLASFFAATDVVAQSDIRGTSVTDGDYAYPAATQNILAFPTAEGFGKYTTGGRGGYVVTVTNLEDDADDPPEGSLRWAISQYPGEPVTVVFDVSGWIFLHDVLRLSKHKGGLTIAGQTAPGEGITLYPRGISFNSAGDEDVNIIVRNIRVRCGSRAWDGSLLDIESPDQTLCTENAYNLIIDHCSFGWSGEELTTNSNSFFQTYQWNIFHEGLYDAGHKKGARGYGVCYGGGACTFTHNLLANNLRRSPRFAASKTYDYLTYWEFVNNVNYNWSGTHLGCYGFDNNGQSTRYSGALANVMNNYWRTGPCTEYTVTAESQLFANLGGGAKSSYMYLNGNKMDRNDDFYSDNSIAVTTDEYVTLVDTVLVPSKFWTSNYTFDVNAYTLVYDLETADEAFASVVEKAGCIVRDSIERRLIRECSNKESTFGGSYGDGGIYGIIDDPIDAEMVMNADSTTYCPVAEESLSRPDGWDSDGDGMPDEWETANGFDPDNADDGNYINAEGYTALEKYLAELMGEEITGDFGDATTVRTVHAVKFGVTVADDKLIITGDDELTQLHVFDQLGRCRLVASLSKGTNTVDVASMPQGVYIVWVTNAAGYRNAVKVTL